METNLEPIAFASCPTCGALAQHIAGDPETWKHHATPQRAGDVLQGLLRSAADPTIGFHLMSHEVAALTEAIASLSASPPVAAPGDGDDWRERERLSLLALRHALEGFEVSIEAAPLESPATYLDRVTLTCEFQPAAGGPEIAKRIATILAAPARAAAPTAPPVAVDDGSVDYARTQAYKWLDERDARVMQLLPPAPASTEAK